MLYVEGYLDHHAVGCGVRRYVNLTGPRQKNLELLYIPTLTLVSLPRDFERRMTEVPLNKGERQKLRGYIRSKVAEFKRLGMRYSKVQVRRALERLA